MFYSILLFALHFNDPAADLFLLYHTGYVYKIA